jgi:hypothetical protein
MCEEAGTMGTTGQHTERQDKTGQDATLGHGSQYTRSDSDAK